MTVDVTERRRVEEERAAWEIEMGLRLVEESRRGPSDLDIDPGEGSAL